MTLKQIVEKNFVLLSKQPNFKMKMFRCKYCPTKCAQHTTRMSSQLLACANCPSIVKRSLEETMKKKKNNSTRQRQVASELESEEDPEQDLQDGAKVKEVYTCESTESMTSSDVEVQGKPVRKVSQFLDKISKNDQIHAEELLTKAIYSSGTPLSIVENSEWLAVFSFLRPTFKVPTRYEVSNKLLDKTFENIKDKVEEKIKNADTVAIQSDGFSNIRNEGIVNVILTTPDPVLFRSIDASKDSQDGIDIAQQISNAIDQVGPQKVLGVCTDNASACKRAWSIIEENYKEDFIFCYGCVAHILHLFVKDILNQESAKITLSNATSISKEIKYSHTLASSLATIQNSLPPNERVTISLKIPGKTRWGSALSCLESLSVNEQNLKLLAINDKNKKLNPVSKNLILSDDFWVQIRKLINLIKLVTVWLKRIQSDDSRISQVPEIFVEFKSHFEKLSKSILPLLSHSEFDNVLKCLQDRKKMAVKPIHYACNILDPTFRGKNLDSLSFSDGTELIIELSDKFGVKKDDLMIEITEFNGESGIFGKDYVKQCSTLVKPIDWRKGSFKDSALSKVAVALLSLPCTSCATERSFNTYSWIHNAKRNRLNNQKAGKIVYISHKVKLLDPSRKAIKKCSYLDYYCTDEESTTEDEK